MVFYKVSDIFAYTCICYPRPTAKQSLSCHSIGWPALFLHVKIVANLSFVTNCICKKNWMDSTTFSVAFPAVDGRVGGLQMYDYQNFYHHFLLVSEGNHLNNT